MSKTIKQMQEMAREIYPNLVSVIPAHWSNPDEEGTKTAIPKQEIPVDLNSLITEVWNEAIKECEKRVKREFNGYGGVLGFTQTGILELLPRADITSDK